MSNIKQENQMDSSGFIPKEMNGWTAGEDKIYDETSIFDYIDGAGEVYRAYQFIKLRARHFSKPENPNILVDLFDMGSSRNAYGVFTHNLEGEEADIGQGSTYQGGLLSFWKGSYFVSLYAERETQESKKTVLELGQEISSRIPNKGKVPEIVSRLPEQDLDRSRIRYFYNPLILNYHFYVGEGNFLNLNPETHAVLGVYGKGDDVYRLLLIQYPDETKAQKSQKDFIRAYMPDSAHSTVVQAEDGKWNGADVKGNVLVIVFEASIKAKAQDVIQRVKK